MVYWLGKWTLANILTGLFLICLLPPMYGWLMGNVVGGLFAQLLAKHETLLWFTQQALGAGYVLLALGGFDFLFLLMVYMAINTVFQRNGTFKDVAGVALRALKGLLLWQIIVAEVFLVLVGERTGIYVYSLIPPFLTQNGISSIYMMVWELSLLLFAFGYAITENGIKAALTGGIFAIGNFIILFAAAGICITITWLPGLCLSAFNLPTWVLVIVGISLHTVLFTVFLPVFLQQEDLVEEFVPKEP